MAAEGKVLPIYFVADESGSMAENIPILNAGLASLLDALHSEPFAASKVRLGIMGFADDTLDYLSIADARDLTEMPQLTSRGTTCFSGVFDALRSRIPDDVNALKAQGYEVNRPAVFFLTDGFPNAGDPWEEALAKLTDAGFREHPNILAFGIGSADPNVVLRIATKAHFAFQSSEGADPGKAIAEFIESLTNSIIQSGQNENNQLIAEKPEGFDQIAVDLDTV